MIVYNAGTFAVLTAGARAFAIVDTRAKLTRTVRGEDAVALALDVITRRLPLPESVASEYLAGFFSNEVRQ